MRAALLLLLFIPGCSDSTPALRLATTTSVDDSGLMDHLGGRFRAERGIRLDVIAVGSGKALALLERGDVTCVITHAPEAERRLMERIEARRSSVFANTFVIVGPEEGDLMAGPFASRGDRSGTHARELRLWKENGRRPAVYVETGRGMAHTLDYAFEKGAFTLTDTATLSAYPKRSGLRLRQTLDRNLYSILSVADERARAFHDWLVSEPGSAAIAQFGLFETP